MALAAQTPEALTKRLFVITLFGIVAYITAVLVLMATREKLPTDTEDFGVTHSAAPHVVSSTPLARLGAE